MSDAQRKMRTRATRLKRALLNEQRTFGHIDDGAGKRYLIGPLYVLGGALENALEFYRWYEEECSDDSGEPIHYLFWALALFRAGDIDGANAKLLETLLQNVYLLPTLLGAPPAPHDMWHSSNRAQPDYLSETPRELLPELSGVERSWIKRQLDSVRFRRALNEYVSTYRALNIERNIEKRRNILRRWDEFLTSMSIDDDEDFPPEEHHPTLEVAIRMWHYAIQMKHGDTVLGMVDVAGQQSIDDEPQRAIWLKSVQHMRSEGHFDSDTATYIMYGIVHEELEYEGWFDDPEIERIVDEMEALCAAHGLPEHSDFTGDPNPPAEWTRLVNAMEHRERAILADVLRQAGEDGMAEQLVKAPDTFLAEVLLTESRWRAVHDKTRAEQGL